MMIVEENHSSADLLTSKATKPNSKNAIKAIAQYDNPRMTQDIGNFGFGAQTGDAGALSDSSDSAYKLGENQTHGRASAKRDMRHTTHL